METNGNRQVNSWNEEEEEKMAGSSADGTPAFMWRFLCWSLRRTTGSEMDLLNEVVFSCKYGGTCGFTEAHRLEKDGALSPGCDPVPSGGVDVSQGLVHIYVPVPPTVSTCG